MSSDTVNPNLDKETGRRLRILNALRDRSITQALLDESLRTDLEDEAKSGDPDRLVTSEMLDLIHALRACEIEQPHLKLFSNTDDVIMIPGFLGSELVDNAGGNGLIWIDPSLLWNSGKLSFLRLNSSDQDANSTVKIQPNGAIPIVYSLLQASLEFGPYRVDIFGFDWRKGIQQSAEELANLIRTRIGQNIRPLHLIAHSQGSLVARRALQLLGSDLARQLVTSLVLLGPASGGTFAAAFALKGNVSLLDTVRQFGVKLPADFHSVLQSMTGLYQLLPWRTSPVGGNSTDLGVLKWLKTFKDFFQLPAFLSSGVDVERMQANFGWASRIDTTFFNDRTSIILGDQSTTAGGVKFDGNKLIADDAFNTTGDGTVPDALAILPGVQRVYKVRDSEHGRLPAYWSVIRAVQKILAGKTPALEQPVVGFEGSENFRFQYLTKLELPSRHKGRPEKEKKDKFQQRMWDVPGPETTIPTGQLNNLGEIPTPAERRLRVFSFDPLLGFDLDALEVEFITLKLPWDWADGNQLSPGPIGEYLEVIDYDPENNCFYPPIDLNHPHLLAQDGLTPSEGDPRFHQQMVYAVAMNTISQFESALGRLVLWAPHLQRNDAGEVISSRSPENEFVRRLRIYPHAMQQANAYYHPDRKALLFGYFRAAKKTGMKNLPGGMVFTCLSYDIIAHETTHALLDGVHRYFTVPSNRDVFAFHEGFADIVAMFQHFSHPDVLRYIITRTRGDITKESEAAVLAAQFGDALGNHGALREYLGRRSRDSEGKVILDDQGRPKWEAVIPDPTALDIETEPHSRGAIFVAALFRAFTNIYDLRVADLRRIAGIDANTELTPDLVSRMAIEAAKAAKHMMTMSIRAIDYVPPVDITFGEYLRGLITADYDLIKNDDRQYRAAVIAAFRDWGIFPSDVSTLAVDSLLWKPPEQDSLHRLKGFFEEEQVSTSTFDGDRLRMYVNAKESSQKFHLWLLNKFRKEPEHSDRELGLALGDKAPHSICRDKSGTPVFEVHSFRPCHRIGPRGEERLDFVVELVQRRKAFFDLNKQQELDASNEKFDRTKYDATKPDFYFRGGSTLVIDPASGEVRYCIRKSIVDDERLDRERQFRQQAMNGENAMYIADGHDNPNPFCMVHRGQG